MLVVLESSLCAQPSLRITQQAYLKASDTRPGAGFGHAVAISGQTAIIGAQEYGAGGIGSAYIYTREGTNWIFQARLRASNPGQDYFGGAVALSGDTAVVGAHWEASNATGVNGNQNNNSANWAGAAYVFVRNGTNWLQQAYLKASNTQAEDHFGYSVAISGDTVVVGAYGESSNATGVNGNQSNNSAPLSGAAYVFVRRGTNWSQEAFLKASNSQAGDLFGGYRLVAISGDTIVVGAAWEDSNATGVNGNQSNNAAADAGAAYVFVREGTNWSQQAYLKASDTRAGDGFGRVAIYGDTVVVGANQYYRPGPGAAYVFVRNGTDWSQQARLRASNADLNDFFGDAVAVWENTIVVGASGENSNATGVDGNPSNNSADNAGAAYVFVRDGTDWSPQAYLKASNTGTDDSFGDAVGVYGDNVIVGALNEDSAAKGVNGNQNRNDATDAGAAYIFSGLEPPVTLTQTRSADQVRLSWPLSAARYLLEQTAALGSSPPTATIWSEVALPYQTNITDISVTVPISTVKQFYRLRKP